jgi:hypothetical protein
MFSEDKPDRAVALVEALPGTPQDLDDDEIIRRAKAAKNGKKFAKLWAGDFAGHTSRSEAVQALCNLLAFWAGPSPDRIDRLFRRSGLFEGRWANGKWDRLGKDTITKALAGRTEFYKPRAAAAEDGDDQPEAGGKKSQATQLVGLVAASRVELFHDPNGEPFVTLPADQHLATVRLRSKAFRDWTCKRFYDACGKAPGSQAVTDALNVLAGKAVHEGAEHPVYVRVAGHGSKVYLDLGDEHWRVVEIDTDGWQVVDRPPVKFRRAKAMRPLPVPVPGGTLAEELRPFLTVRKKDWPLVLAWLVAALRPTGPYPVLGFHGEQGSGKSTQARVLRSLIDPNTAPVRAEPREARDLAIAANNGLVVSLDNVSYLPPWLSDALCRLSTGGGFATRTLYENDEETIFEGQRPAILNGIEEVATRPDLLDRSLLISLPAIPEDERSAEGDYWAAFERARPRALGALLDAVSAGLRNLPGVHLDRLPRMADFALWGVACEHAMGLKPGAFLRAYAKNRDAANETALDASILAAPLRRFLEQQDGDEWTGTVSQLLECLTPFVSEQAARSREWPKRPHVLSGKLRRLAPNLRKAGVFIEFTHDGKSRKVTIRKERDSSVSTVVQR